MPKSISAHSEPEEESKIEQDLSAAQDDSQDAESFNVSYFENNDTTTKIMCQLRLYSIEKGFSVTPNDKSEDPGAAVFSIKWEDSAALTLEDSKQEVYFNNACGGTIKFDCEGDFLFFKCRFEENTPDENSFLDISHNIIPRRGSSKPSTSARTADDEVLQEMNIIHFPLLVYRHSFFGGWSWKPSQIVLEENIDGKTFWSVSIF